MTRTRHFLIILTVCVVSFTVLLLSFEQVRSWAMTQSGVSLIVSLVALSGVLLSTLTAEDRASRMEQRMDIENRYKREESLIHLKRSELLRQREAYSKCIKTLLEIERGYRQEVHPLYSAESASYTGAVLNLRLQTLVAVKDEVFELQTELSDQNVRAVADELFVFYDEYYKAGTSQSPNGYNSMQYFDKEILEINAKRIQTKLATAVHNNLHINLVELQAELDALRT